MNTPRLRVGVVDDYPEAFGCFLNLPTNSCIRPGFEVEVFDSICRKVLKWDYDFVVPEGHYGYYSNNTWYGLLGMVARNEVDATAVTIVAKEERLQLMDFSTFVSYFQQVYIIKQPRALDMDSVLLAPFSFYAWFSLLAVFIVSSLILATKYYLQKKIEGFSQFTKAFSGALWDTFGLAMKQHECRSIYKYRNYLARVVLLAVGLLLGTLYSSIVASRLSVPLRSTIPFFSTEELAKLMLEKKFSLLSHAPGRRPDCWNCSLFEEALKFNPVVVEPNSTKLTELLNTGKYAQWDTEDLVAIPGDVKEDEKDRIMIKDKSALPFGVSFAFPKGSMYRRKFDENLRKYIVFVLTMKNRYTHYYFDFDRKNKPKRVRISVFHYYETLMLYVSGIAISCSMFVLEYIYYKLNESVERQHVAVF